MRMEALAELEETEEMRVIHQSVVLTQVPAVTSGRIQVLAVEEQAVEEVPEEELCSMHNAAP